MDAIAALRSHDPSQPIVWWMAVPSTTDGWVDKANTAHGFSEAMIISYEPRAATDVEGANAAYDDDEPWDEDLRVGQGAGNTVKLSLRYTHAGTDELAWYVEFYVPYAAWKAGRDYAWTQGKHWLWVSLTGDPRILQQDPAAVVWTARIDLSLAGE